MIFKETVKNAAYVIYKCSLNPSCYRSHINSNIKLGGSSENLLNRMTLDISPVLLRVLFRIQSYSQPDPPTLFCSSLVSKLSCTQQLLPLSNPKGPGQNGSFFTNKLFSTCIVLPFFLSVLK